MKTVNKIWAFFKKETVLCIAGLLAVISAFIVVPSKEYIGYIDFRTLALLFSLMAVVAGFRDCQAFDFIAAKLLGIVKNLRQLVAILVFLCFFLAMFITNDVALITFVPFTILILESINKRGLIIYTVVLQTIAANLGSVLLPVGNPQNLYLYGLSGMSILDFILTMLPLWAESLVLIVLSLMFVKKDSIEYSPAETVKLSNPINYVILFILCLLTVANVVPYYWVFVIVLADMLIFNRKILKRVDYLLLLTFVCFFIFIGNMKNMPSVTIFMERIITGRELGCGIVFSQVISNVPAAVLLSGFTSNVKALLLGTNIGGLGTLIASLASLISYKIYSNSNGHQNGKYMAVFTGMNLAFLIIITLLTVSVL